MKELTQQELLNQVSQAEGSFAVFLYTPFCGTCQLAARMLGILLQMEPSLPLFQSNVNFLPAVIREWQITSVPCLVILGHGEIQEKIYKMQDVHALYQELLPLRGQGTQEQ